MLGYIKSKLPPWTGKIWAIVWQWIGIPLLTLFISSIVVLRFYNWLVGPDTYTVYLVGDFSNNKVQRCLRPAFEEAFREAQKSNLQINHVNINVRTLDAPDKEAEKISDKLVKRNDTLLIVGHLSTTASASALPNYLNTSPPIPVILPIETNPELLPADHKINYYPVFRLSPTDDQQAAKAAGFVIGNKAKSIWVVQDSVTNPVYSRYLAKEFVHKVHEMSESSKARQEQVSDTSPPREEAQASVKGQSHKTRLAMKEGRSDYQANENQGGEERHSKVALWTEILEPPSPDLVNKLGIDWVFFAGDPLDCLIVTRQVKDLWKDQLKKPNILLGSMCVSSELLDQGVAEDSKEAYLTHSMEASDFNTRGGFALRGAQAFELVEQLIKGADDDFRELSVQNAGIGYYLRWLFGFHSVLDARNALRAFMERGVNSEQTYNLQKQEYTFRRDWTVKESQYHVWQVQPISKETKLDQLDQKVTFQGCDKPRLNGLTFRDYEQHRAR